MAVDYPAMRDKVFARYPHLRSTASERSKLFARHPQPARSPQRFSEAPTASPSIASGF
jgi:hypothetical protein